MEVGMFWLKQHADTLVILSSFALCFWNLNEKINSLEKDVAIMKTVMILQKVMPVELCHHEEKIQEKI